MSKIRFHLVALPHTNVNTEHTSCAFNQKVLKFARMMKGLGHEVFLYSSEIADDVILPPETPVVGEKYALPPFRRA